MFYVWIVHPDDTIKLPPYRVIRPELTVAEFKRKVCDRFQLGLEPSMQFWFKGVLLEDDTKTLKDYGLTENASVNVTFPKPPEAEKAPEPEPESESKAETVRVVGYVSSSDNDARRGYRFPRGATRGEAWRKRHNSEIVEVVEKVQPEPEPVLPPQPENVYKLEINVIEEDDVISICSFYASAPTEFPQFRDLFPEVIAAVEIGAFRELIHIDPTMLPRLVSFLGNQMPAGMEFGIPAVVDPIPRPGRHISRAPIMIAAEVDNPTLPSVDNPIIPAELFGNYELDPDIQLALQECFISEPVPKAKKVTKVDKGQQTETVGLDKGQQTEIAGASGVQRDDQWYFQNLQRIIEESQDEAMNQIRTAHRRRPQQEAGKEDDDKDQGRGKDEEKPGTSRDKK